MKAGRMALSVLVGIFALAAAQGDEVLTDDEVKARIVKFVRMPGMLCGRATVDFRKELRTRKLTNRPWFDGDTNRLARLICELAQTNDVKVAGMMVRTLGEYGTPAQLPFLYSCATNPVVGDRAMKAILNIEGVTSNSIEVAESFFSASNRVDGLLATHVCFDFIRRASEANVEPSCASNALRVAYDFSIGEKCHFCWLDRAQIGINPSYRFSRRRLAYMRQIAERGIRYEYQANYVTNAINELVAYPEANLPE